MISLVAHTFGGNKRSSGRNMEWARSQYITTLTNDRDTECLTQLRISIRCFRSLCEIVRNKGLLKDTRQVLVEEQLALFLHMVGHNVKN